MLNEQPFRSNALGRVTVHESICHSLMVAMVFSSLYALSGPLFSSFPLFTYLTYNMSYFALVLPIKLHSYLRAHAYSAAKGIQERGHQKDICWLVCVSKLHKSHWECNDMPSHTHISCLFSLTNYLCLPCWPMSGSSLYQQMGDGSGKLCPSSPDDIWVQDLWHPS